METNQSVINPLIANRWSPRAFADKQVDENQLFRMLDAARRAASSFNLQPWRFIYALKGKGEGFDQILDALVDVNQAWAKNAPVLMVTVARMHDNHGNPNAHAWHDVGLAMGNFTLQGMTEGLYLHQMGGFSAEKAKSNLGIPEGYEPVAVVAIGYPGDPDQLPETMRNAEMQASPRRPLEEVVFREKWGKPIQDPE